MSKVTSSTSVELWSESPIAQTKDLQLSFHVQKAAQRHFFSKLSPWTIFQGVVHGTVSVFITTLISAVESCKTLAVKVYVLSLELFYRCIQTDRAVHGITFALNYCIQDTGFDQKIESMRAQLEEKNSTTLYTDFEKTVVLAIIHKLKIFAIPAPGTYPAEIFRDKVAHCFVQKNEAILSKVFSFHILKILSNLSDRLQEVQSKYPYALVDLAHVVLDKVPPHFDRCKLAADRGELVPTLPDGMRKKYYLALSTAICEVLFPEGGKEFELPINKVVGSYLSDFLFTKLKTKLIPHLLEKAFNHLFNENVKNRALEKLFQNMHKTIDHPSNLDFDEESVKMLYDKLGELTESFGNCVSSFFKYTDPTVIPWILQGMAPMRIGQLLAKVLVKKCELITLQDLLLLALQESLLEINPQGIWNEIEEVMRFFPGEPQLPVSHECHCEKKVTLKEIEELASITGKDLTGIVAILQKVIFNPSDTTRSEEIPGFASKIAAFARNLYARTTENVVAGGVWATDLSGRIQKINNALVQKLPLPEHELLVYEVIRATATFLGCHEMR